MRSNANSRNYEAETMYKGLPVKGRIITGDTEGDASEPGGRLVRRLPAYVLDIQVFSPEGDDLTNEFNDGFITCCEAELLRSE